MNACKGPDQQLRSYFYIACELTATAQRGSHFLRERREPEQEENKKEERKGGIKIGKTERGGGENVLFYLTHLYTTHDDLIVVRQMNNDKFQK